MRSGASFRVRDLPTTPESSFTPESSGLGRLAARTPVGRPRAEAQPGERDRRAAAPAWPAAAPIDPQAFGDRHAAGRPAAEAGRRLHDVGRELAPGDVDELRQPRI